MTPEERTQVLEAMSVAIKQIEFVLDSHGSRLEYPAIAKIYPLLQELVILKYSYMPSLYS